jgi:GTP-binding protein
VVAYKDKKSFVVADIPGLIEGASLGHGLGHQFLKHVERCRVLVHLVDLSAGAEGRRPLDDFDTINRELTRYSAALADKPQVVVANKLDLPDAREAWPAFTEAMKKRGIRALAMSGATGEGSQAVLDACARVLFGGVSKKAHAPGEVRAVVTANEALAAARPPRAKAASRAGTKKSVSPKSESKQDTRKVAAASGNSRRPRQAGQTPETRTALALRRGSTRAVAKENAPGQTRRRAAKRGRGSAVSNRTARGGR